MPCSITQHTNASGVPRFWVVQILLFSMLITVVTPNRPSGASRSVCSRPQALAARERRSVSAGTRTPLDCSRGVVARGGGLGQMRGCHSTDHTGVSLLPWAFRPPSICHRCSSCRRCTLPLTRPTSECHNIGHTRNCAIQLALSAALINANTCDRITSSETVDGPILMLCRAWLRELPVIVCDISIESASV
jgi:hypothetical protein